MGVCIPSVPDTAAGIFVASGGMGGACGSEAQPCGTIAQGLAAIATSAGTKKILYLANGTYTEHVALPAGITVQGGWFATGGLWMAQCVANRQSGAIIAAPAGDSVAVAAQYSGTTTLDTLTVQNNSTATAGQALFGIVATGAGTILGLTNVDVSVAGGGAGIPGGVGSNGTNGVGTCTTSGNGAMGGAGADGVGASPGTYSASSAAIFSPGAGGMGMPGGNGSAGVAAAAGSCVNTTDICTDDGTGGGGCITSTFQCCNKPAVCGNPGTGSGAGSPGGGGGSSVAVFVGGATVTATGGTWKSGNGGNGGDGGAGGTPGTGSLGTPSLAGKYLASPCTVKKFGTGTLTTYECIGTISTVCSPAGPNAPGGNGGQGGHGGGGAGGDSYAYYVAGGSLNASMTTLTPGMAGLGGSQGSTYAGANGTSAPHN